MELRHIPLNQLHISPLNMRHEKKAPDIADILPSIRRRGILQPLLVRPNADGFEIVAGRRRYYSAKTIEKDTGSYEPVPCAVLEENDDAAALEASLLENMARLDPDPITQFETFAKLVLEGRNVEQIALTFGMKPREVEQRLALGNLHPKIRKAAKADKIDMQSLQLLTMATQQKQIEWLAKRDKPYGYQLNQWLFGGQSIKVSAALFPLEEFRGEIVSDLFGDERYFVEASEFWAAQETALASRTEALLKSKWAEVVVLERGSHFDQWAHEKVAKKDGGKVFVTVSHQGEVEFFYGWLPRKEVRKAKPAAKDAGKNERPAMTQAMENYLELHRHAAVRLALLADPGKALRLLVAHAIAPSGNWNVRSERQACMSNAILASLEASRAQSVFAERREKVEELLSIPVGIDPDERTAHCFVKLLALSDSKVMQLAIYAMSDSLASGSLVAELAGSVLEVDPRTHWQADDCFLELIRDKATLTAMIAEVAGKDVAKANADGKAATLRQIIRDALAGQNGRKKADGWLPGWMAFPFVAYGKGASGLAEASATVKKLLRKL